jgi:hypothetical protein
MDMSVSSFQKQSTAIKEKIKQWLCLMKITRTRASNQIVNGKYMGNFKKI